MTNYHDDTSKSMTQAPDIPGVPANLGTLQQELQQLYQATRKTNGEQATRSRRPADLGNSTITIRAK